MRRMIPLSRLCVQHGTALWKIWVPPKMWNYLVKNITTFFVNVNMQCKGRFEILHLVPRHTNKPKPTPSSHLFFTVLHILLSLVWQKLQNQNFYELYCYLFTPIDICLCNAYYINYAPFLCSYLEGNMLTSVPKELASLKQLSLVYVLLT